jgi:serine/threonine-protein kinase RsbT
MAPQQLEVVEIDSLAEMDSRSAIRSRSCGCGIVVSQLTPLAKDTQMESALTVADCAADGGAACLSIGSDDDIVRARVRSRSYALALGFSSPEATLVATAISELARNIVQYAQRGEIALQAIERDGRSGLLVIASDRGPGVPEAAKLAFDSPQTHAASGLGLRALKRLMDDVQLVSMAGEGTTVRVTRWKPGVT